jgi:hypothetical protein
LLLFASQTLNINVLVAQTTSIPFLVNNGGADTETTAGTADALSAGYARIQPDSTSSTPTGVAMFGLRTGGVLVSETGVPASAAISSGRIYAEINGSIRTALAIANPSSQDAEIAFYFSDQTRTSFGSGTTTIPANTQVAKFLEEEPFNSGETSVNGTFTFSANTPVAAVALRGLTNERSEFLMTTLPVSPLIDETGDTIYFPHFTDGLGWTTEVILVNPTDLAMAGTVQFLEPGSGSVAAQPLSLTVNDQTASTFSYSIPGRSSQKLQTDGASATTLVGSVRIMPSTNTGKPSGLSVISFRSGAVTVTEAGVSAAAVGQAFRLYAEVTGEDAGSIQTGIAITNPASDSVAVNFELLTPGGGSTGLTGTTTIAGSGQRALFVNQIEGMESLPTPFEGVLRISTMDPAKQIAVVGLRIRTNERSEFLITTTPLVDEADTDITEDRFYPHLVDGGGFTTQFIQLSGSTEQTLMGTLGFVSEAGSALDLSLASFNPGSITWQIITTNWEASSTPPDCENPLVLPVPMSLSGATSILYPGQLRGGNYKAHGGFRFDNNGQGTDVQIHAPQDAELFRAARYLEGGKVQYLFDFVNPCGIMCRLDHLRVLSSRLQAIANTLPGPLEGQSQTTNLAPGQTIRAGEILATEIGTTGNVFFDWGVYDLRSMNAASNDAAWLAEHPGEQAPYAICWLEYLSPSNAAIVNNLLPSDGVSGSMSDYCN